MQRPTPELVLLALVMLNVVACLAAIVYGVSRAIVYEVNRILRRIDNER